MHYNRARLVLPQVYKEGIVKLSLNCAGEAAKHNVKLYIEMSSGQMVSSEKVSKMRPRAVDKQEQE